MPLDGGNAEGLPGTTGGGGAATAWVLSTAARQLKDETNDEWTVTVLIPYLWGSIVEICDIKPDAYAPSVTVSLVAGVIQSLPTGAKDILSAGCNMGVSGTVRGEAINGIIDREVMDKLLPNWQTYTASGVVKHVIVDPEGKKRTPVQFFVFPPQPATPTDIELVVSKIPTEITAIGDTFPLGDDYRMPVVDLIVSRALAEEGTIPNALAKSAQYRNQAMQAMGIKVKPGA